MFFYNYFRNNLLKSPLNKYIKFTYKKIFPSKDCEAQVCILLCKINMILESGLYT